MLGNNYPVNQSINDNSLYYQNNMNMIENNFNENSMDKSTNLMQNYNNQNNYYDNYSLNNMQDMNNRYQNVSNTYKENNKYTENSFSENYSPVIEQPTIKTPLNINENLNEKETMAKRREQKREKKNEKILDSLKKTNLQHWNQLKQIYTLELEEFKELENHYNTSPPNNVDINLQSNQFNNNNLSNNQNENENYNEGNDIINIYSKKEENNYIENNSKNVENMNIYNNNKLNLDINELIKNELANEKFNLPNINITHDQNKKVTRLEINKDNANSKEAIDVSMPEELENMKSGFKIDFDKKHLSLKHLSLKLDLDPLITEDDLSFENFNENISTDFFSINEETKENTKQNENILEINNKEVIQEKDAVKEIDTVKEKEKDIKENKSVQYEEKNVKINDIVNESNNNNEYTSHTDYLSEYLENNSESKNSVITIDEEIFDNNSNEVLNDENKIR